MIEQKTVLKNIFKFWLEELLLNNLLFVSLEKNTNIHTQIIFINQQLKLSKVRLKEKNFNHLK